MIKIKEHLEENLKTAQQSYDDAFNRHSALNEKLKLLAHDVGMHKWDMEHAEKDIIYYQELLNELNDRKTNSTT